MKLKFEMRRAHIEQLHRILSILNGSLWGQDEKIYFYFDNQNVVIYPEERGGFDRVWGRIHIGNLVSENGGFFSAYTVKSMKAKNSVLLCPRKLASLVEDLKVVVDLNCDACFKLTQMADADAQGQKKQYLEVTGHNHSFAGSTFKSHVEVTTVFSETLYPEELTPKEADF